MSAWINVAPVLEFLPGSCRHLDMDGTPIAVFNIDGVFYAIEDICSHGAETLSQGPLHGLEITCPRHQSRFSLRTGEALSPPANEPITLFPTRVDNGMVQISVSAD